MASDICRRIKEKKIKLNSELDLKAQVCDADRTRPAEMPILEEPSNNDKQIEAIESAFNLFYPRSHWTTPSVWSCSETERSLVILLSAMIRNGIVDRITDRAKMEFCGGRYALPPGSWSEEQQQMYWLCQSRRGNDDLKMQSWSAYLELQKRFPEDEVAILASPCFLAYSERQHTAIVPGNCPPRSMLDFVATHRLRFLFFINGCADEAILQQEGASEDKDYWLLDGLKFSDRAIDLFAEEFAKERASIDRLLSVISRGMPPVIDSIFSDVAPNNEGLSHESDSGHQDANDARKGNGEHE